MTCQLSCSTGSSMPVRVAAGRGPTTIAFQPCAFAHPHMLPVIPQYLARCHTMRQWLRCMTLAQVLIEQHEFCCTSTSNTTWKQSRREAHMLAEPAVRHLVCPGPVPCSMAPTQYAQVPVPFATAVTAYMQGFWPPDAPKPLSTTVWGGAWKPAASSHLGMLLFRPLQSTTKSADRSPPSFSTTPAHATACVSECAPASWLVLERRAPPPHSASG